MKQIIAVIFVSLIVVNRPAKAAEATSLQLARLFTHICLTSHADPPKVRAWAKEHDLKKIEDPQTRAMFVGEGNKGEAWSVPSDSGHFALSLRGPTEACALWATIADADEVEQYFIQIIKTLESSGMHTKVANDQKSDSPSGVIHTLVYQATSDGNMDHGSAFTMITIHDPGNTFQATLQLANFTNK